MPGKLSHVHLLSELFSVSIMFDKVFIVTIVRIQKANFFREVGWQYELTVESFISMCIPD